MAKLLIAIIHTSKKFKAKIDEWEKFGLHLLYLPPYSPELNPIEMLIHMSGALGHSDPNTITKYLTMNYLTGSKIASDMIQK